VTLPCAARVQPRRTFVDMLYCIWRNPMDELGSEGQAVDRLSLPGEKMRWR
jgi:hypothetical protein